MKMRGRPPKEKIVALATIMDRLLPEEEVLNKLSELVQQGNIRAISLWMNFRRGMPKQIIETTSEHTLMNFNVKDLVKFDDSTEQ